MKSTAKRIAEEINTDLVKLYAYARLAGVSVQRLARGDVSKREILSLKEFHNDEKIRKQVEQELHRKKKRVRYNRQQKTLLDNPDIQKYGYDKKHYIKLLAQVKWFYNQQLEREEGYVTFFNKFDFYFQGDVVDGADPFHLRKGKDVVISVNKSDFTRTNIPVSKLKLLEHEDDKLFLIHQAILPKTSKSTFNQAFKILKQNEVTASELKNTPIETSVSEMINSSANRSLSQAKIVYLINEITQWYEEKNLINTLFNILPNRSKYALWRDFEFSMPFTVMKDILSEAIVANSQTIEVISARLSSKDFEELSNEVVISLKDEKSIIQIFKAAQKHDITLSIKELPDDQLYALWKKDLIKQVPINLIADELDHLYKDYLSEKKDTQNRKGTNRKISELINHLQDLDSFMELMLAQIERHKKTGDFDLFVRINFFIEKWTSSKEERSQLQNKLEIFPLDFLYEKLINRFIADFKIENIIAINHKSFKSEKADYFRDKVLRSEIIRELFNSINFEYLKKLYYRSVYELGNMDSEEGYKEFMFFLNFLPRIQAHTSHNCTEIKSYYLKRTYINGSSFYKLKMFVDDYTDDIDYNDAVIYTVFLSPVEQKTFFKKIIRGIETSQLSLGIEDLKRMITMDYQLSEDIKQIDGETQDFTISVLLKLIEDLSKGKTTRQDTIFNLIANQVKTPQDLLQITGFFDKCDGRTLIEEKRTENEAGEMITTWSKKKTEHLAHTYDGVTYAEYCDGRKAVNKNSDEPSLCNKSGLEFWWCENSKCYEACRTNHNFKGWRSYTLRDVLRILKINFDERQYEITLSVINRVNRFLDHLTCRNCNHILKPVGRSNYAFYGVTRFHCDQDDCTEKEKEIYLSHCLNPKCFGLIDSRDSVRCKTKDIKDSYGWYICNYCYGCCATSKISAKKYRIESTGQDYNGHLNGHRDRGVICCKECGFELQNIKPNPAYYQTLLNWFIENKESNPQITNYGKRKDGKWWFVWAKGNLSDKEYRQKLKEIRGGGFNIPDISDTFKDHQLIAEPYKNKKMNFFVCNNCDHVLDFNIREGFPLARKIAIDSFHKVAVEKVLIHD